MYGSPVHHGYFGVPWALLKPKHSWQALEGMELEVAKALQDAEARGLALDLVPLVLARQNLMVFGCFRIMFPVDSPLE